MATQALYFSFYFVIYWTCMRPDRERTRISADLSSSSSSISSSVGGNEHFPHRSETRLELGVVGSILLGAAEDRSRRRGISRWVYLVYLGMTGPVDR
jgi:hypothetical protein